MTSYMAILTNLFMGTSVFVCGASSVMWMSIMESVGEDTIIEGLLGPLGALALALTSLYLIVKYVFRQQKRMEKMQDERYEEMKQRAEYYEQKSNQQ